MLIVIPASEAIVRSATGEANDSDDSASGEAMLYANTQSVQAPVEGARFANKLDLSVPVPIAH